MFDTAVADYRKGKAIMQDIKRTVTPQTHGGVAESSRRSPNATTMDRRDGIAGNVFFSVWAQVQAQTKKLHGVLYERLEQVLHDDVRVMAQRLHHGAHAGSSARSFNIAGTGRRDGRRSNGKSSDGKKTRVQLMNYLVGLDVPDNPLLYYAQRLYETIDSLMTSTIQSQRHSIEGTKCRFCPGGLRT